MPRVKASPCVFTSPATASLRRTFPLSAPKSSPQPNLPTVCESQITLQKYTKMEGILQRDSSPPSMLADLIPIQDCENQLSPSHSDLTSNSNSSFTVDNSKGRLHQIEDSAKDCVTAWTDEKHDLYLDHLESSFVEQLHRSRGVLSWRSDDDSKSHYLSRNLIAKTRKTSKQFKVVQTDCLDNIDLKRKNPHMFAEFSDQNFAAEASVQMCRTKRPKTILSKV